MDYLPTAKVCTCWYGYYGTKEPEQWLLVKWASSDHYWYEKIISCGVPLVALQCRDLMACSTAGKTTSHWDTHRFLKAKATCFQIIPLYCSHWPFPWGLVRYSYSSLDKNKEPWLECIYKDVSNVVNIWFRHLINILIVILEQANGKQEFIHYRKHISVLCVRQKRCIKI